MTFDPVHTFTADPIDEDVPFIERESSTPVTIETKTTTLRRLRAAAKLVRDERGYPSNWIVEVGTRWIPVYATNEYEARRVNSNRRDDLYDTFDLKRASSEDQCQGTGVVVHLYFTSLGYEGELVDVATVWTGTSESAPVVIA